MLSVSAESNHLLKDGSEVLDILASVEVQTWLPHEYIFALKLQLQCFCFKMINFTFFPVFC